MPSSRPDAADRDDPAGGVGAARPGTPPVAHLADLVSRAAAERPDHDAVRDLTGPAPLTVSWAALDAAVVAEAERLRAAGVRPGDRVAIALPDGAAFCVALFGALRADAAVVPLAPDSVPRELAAVLGQAAPAVVLADPADRAATDAAAACGARALPPPDPAAARPPGRPAGPRPDADPEAIALIVFTSGTTGRPRGVQLSHRALLANREQAAALRPAPVNGVDRVLLALPLFHVYGLAAGLLQVCRAGATVVLPGRFDPERTLTAVVDERVSVIAGVPSMFRMLLDLGADRLRPALGGVRLCTSGGAPLPGTWLTAFREATGLDLHEGYGLSEGGPVVTTNDLDRPAKPGSVGRPLPGVELRLVDGEGRPLTAAPEPPPHDGDPLDDLDYDDGSDPADDTGLIALRGPNLFSGYWPDGHGGPDDDGWFRTADVGYLDADGDLHLVDRSSDLVIVNGFNVYPREVEQVIAELDAVAEVAVVGIPDDRTGAAVKAVVVERPGAGLTEEVVREHCAARLARFKRPAVVAFTGELPRTPTGKIARRVLARL